MDHLIAQVLGAAQQYELLTLEPQKNLAALPGINMGGVEIGGAGYVNTIQNSRSENRGFGIGD
ncbi:MAG: hypothetical protein H6908_01085 [Hyphomicrobiales bacterium]|nr:hypothetical protein [Hyphomicrobiales bacterium]